MVVVSGSIGSSGGSNIQIWTAAAAAHNMYTIFSHHFLCETKTYGEVGPSYSLLRTSLISLIQTRYSDRYSYEKIHTVSLGTARWAELSARHHIKPTPRGSGLMW